MDFQIQKKSMNLKVTIWKFSHLPFIEKINCYKIEINQRNNKNKN